MLIEDLEVSSDIKFNDKYPYKAYTGGDVFHHVSHNDMKEAMI